MGSEMCIRDRRDTHINVCPDQGQPLLGALREASSCECGLEFSNAFAVPGSNQRCGNKEARLLHHQLPVFIDQRGRPLSKYAHGSKVLDRLAARTDHFVLNTFLFLNTLIQRMAPTL